VNSLNAVLLSPAKMYVISWHDPARIPADELRKRGLASTPEEIAGYFHLACLATPDAVVVASSGWPQPGWTMLANNSVLVVDRVTLHTSEFSLEPAPRSPAGRLPARVRHSPTPQMIMGMWPSGNGVPDPKTLAPPAWLSSGRRTCDSLFRAARPVVTSKPTRAKRRLT
jgi:hypothetical protein